MFLSDSTSSGLFFTINYFVVINHILHYENAKALTKRLWATDLFLTALLYPLSSIFSPLKNGGFAYI